LRYLVYPPVSKSSGLGSEPLFSNWHRDGWKLFTYTTWKSCF